MLYWCHCMFVFLTGKFQTQDSLFSRLTYVLSFTLSFKLLVSGQLPGERVQQGGLSSWLGSNRYYSSLQEPKGLLWCGGQRGCCS